MTEGRTKWLSAFFGVASSATLASSFSSNKLVSHYTTYVILYKLSNARMLCSQIIINSHIHSIPSSRQSIVLRLLLARQSVV